MKSADQERMLGALLGMAIGDAMGMPVVGMSAAEIASAGAVTGFRPRLFADGSEIRSGEFTEESEIALCIVESVTANGGAIDPENIGVRMQMLAAGEAKRWIEPDTLAAIAAADARDWAPAPLVDDGPATADLLARGIPVGLMHAVGDLDDVALRADAEAVTRITHGSPLAISAVTAVAYAVQLAARGEVPRGEWAGRTAAFIGNGAVAERLAALEPGSAVVTAGPGDRADEVLASAFAALGAGDSIAEVVLAAVNAGGAADSRAAIAGALVGAEAGSSGVPQQLIDDLEGRIYLSLAAPWFYRTVQRLRGRLIDLRPERG